MKTKINLIIFSMLVLCQQSIAQNKLSLGSNYEATINNSASSQSGNIKSTNDLEFQNAMLKMELEELKAAYNSLEQKFEKRKLELEQYQKLLQQNNIIPAANTFSCINIKNAAIHCGDAFLEPILPTTFSNNSVITFFIADGFKESLIGIYNDKDIEILDCKIEQPGYGQVTINANILKHGTYNCCLLADGRKVDCKKMVLLK